jgi:uncharacterized protein YbjT (DUF2867 family)
MGDAAALDRLMDGAHGVYAVTDFFRNGLLKEVAQGCAIADAAARAKVSHYVCSSISLAERGTNIPYLDAKARIEQHVKKIGLPATVLRPTLFMEDLTQMKYAPPVWWGTVRRVIGPDTRVLWVAVDDVGAVAAKVLAAPAPFIGRELTLAGDYRSITEAREIFRAVDGKVPLAIPLPVWIWRRFINADLPPLWEWLARNPVHPGSDIETLRGVHPGLMNMETWLRRKRATAA